MTDSISRRDLGKYLAAAALTPQLHTAAQTASSYGKGKIEPFNYIGVRLLDGMLRDQFLSARDFFKNLPDDDLLLVFRTRAGLPAPGKPLLGWYGADTFHPFGQYLGGMARMAKAAGDQALMDKAAGLAREWSKTIEPDGYFFASRKPNVYHYTYEKMTGGLVDLCEYGGLREVIPYLERITAWAEKNLDRTRCRALDGCNFAANGTEWYTLCENLYRAHLLSGDGSYMKFGDLWRYPAYWSMFDGKGEPAPYGFHAYSHVNTLCSAAMTYAVSGDPQYLRQIRNAFDWLEKTQMYASGGFGPRELLMRPDGQLGRELETTEATFETVCGSWACFKLSRYLMIHTGEARYGDWMEKMLYNGIGAALRIKRDGSNFYYSDYHLGGGRKSYHPVSRWSCCSGTYPQAIADYHNIIYFRDPDTLYVNLFVPSEVSWKRGAQTMTLTQQTKYPESGKTEVTLNLGAPEEFSLAFRVPRWSSGATLAVNGTRHPEPCTPGTWARIRRTWKPGDRVTFDLPMQPRFVPVDAQHPNRVAVVSGPVLLARKSAAVLPVKRDAADLIAPSGPGLEFRAKTQRDSIFQPFYRFGLLESYDVYFDLEG